MNNHYKAKIYRDIPIVLKQKPSVKLSYNVEEVMDILITYCNKEKIIIEYFILNKDNILAQVQYIDKHNKAHIYDMWCEMLINGRYKLYSTLDIHTTDKHQPKVKQLKLF